MPRPKTPKAKPAAAFAALASALGQPALPATELARLGAFVGSFTPGQKVAVGLWPATEGPGSRLAVLAPDQPFLTDTVALYARRLGLDIADLRHPVLGLSRDAAGTLTKWSGPQREALIYLSLPPLALEQGEQLQAAVRAGIGAAQGVVADFAAMRGRMEDERHRLTATRQASRDELAFIDWLLDNHFILLGMRQYRYRDGAGGKYMQMVPGSGLGILRHAPSRAEQPMPVAKMGPSLANYLDVPGAVIVSKAFTHAPIHRDAAMDYLGLRTFDSDGNVQNEWRILGLFTSKAYTNYVGDIPLLASKLAAVRDNLGFAPGSYSARVLQNILETWPRDELFLSSADSLTRLAALALKRREQSATAVLVRDARREGAASVQVWVPTLRYESRLRGQLAELLEKITAGHVSDQRLDMGDGESVRLFFRLQMAGGKTLDEKTITEQVERLVGGWADEAQRLLYQQAPLPVAAKLWKGIGQNLPSAYRATQSPAQAAADLLAFNSLPADGRIRLEAAGGSLFIRAYSPGTGWPLHRLLPLLASFGLKTAQEQHYPLTTPQGPASLQVIEIEGAFALAPEVLARVAEGVEQALNGAAEADDLNSLVVNQNFELEAIGWLRAWVACAQQAGRRYGAGAVRGFLLHNPGITADLVALFRARLQPGLAEAARTKQIKLATTRLKAAIVALPGAEDEAIATVLQQMILAMVRTNAWQPGRLEKGAALAFKFESEKLHDWPRPLVYREIFVYHPLVEGVHLRGGPVARGGLRFSDRPYDYRLEILGLQQAQQRKNTIIVPVGAKGGFVLRQPATADFGAVQAYQMFVRGLLSVTDSYDSKGKVVHPRGVICLDGDDPYLVVAADKGTATFSDTANTLSAEADYWDNIKGGYWLGDAFASGGSNGYDHKHLAITARGAWLSVQHHLKALAIEPDAKRPIILAGIGDPSGDVFGNGVVREPHALLVAAFNHKHIFLDPNPGAAKSFAERERLLREVKGWDAYDTKLISAGGGLFPRSAKRIPLSKAMGTRLGFKKSEATPDEVIRAILKAPVDVLWNGGIGTYIRASDERDEDVGDKANDAVRVAAREVRARIIGEGGNLGVSPRGRIELNLRGVLLNSDALDNSAGVDTSDHEVNLKILLGLKKDWRGNARNELLKRCTDQVADAVLTDNVRQNLAISLEAAGKTGDHRDLFALQQSLLKRGVVSEVVDNLPTLPQLLARPEGKYSRPELAGLMAGTKLVLREELLKPELRPLLGSEVGRAALTGYFPAVLPDEILKLAPRHALAAEITATVLVNRLINRLGLLLVPRLSAELNATPTAALQAALLAEQWVAGEAFWRDMDALEQKLPLPALLAAYDRVRAVVATVAAWIVQHNLKLPEALALSSGMAEAPARLGRLLTPSARRVLEQRVAGWNNLGFTPALSERLSLLSPMIIVPDALRLAGKAKPDDSLRMQLAVGEALHLPALVQKARGMSFADGWSRQAVTALLLEFLHRQHALSAHLLRHKLDIAGWKKRHAAAVDRYLQVVAQVTHEKSLTVAMLSVVIGRLRELAP